MASASAARIRELESKMSGLDTSIQELEDMRDSAEEKFAQAEARAATAEEAAAAAAEEAAAAAAAAKQHGDQSTAKAATVSTGVNTDEMKVGASPPPAPAPAVVEPPAAPAVDPQEAMVKLLVDGHIFLKHGRRGKPHARFVWWSPSLDAVNWRELGKDRVGGTIRTRDIQQVSVGRTTKVFGRDAKGARERAGVHNACFAIIGNARTLDLEVDCDGDRSVVSEAETTLRDAWVDAIRICVLREPPGSSNADGVGAGGGAGGGSESKGPR